jgi:hypothetical protein
VTSTKIRLLEAIPSRRQLQGTQFTFEVDGLMQTMAACGHAGAAIAGLFGCFAAEALPHERTEENTKRTDSCAHWGGAPRPRRFMSLRRGLQ